MRHARSLIAAALLLALAVLVASGGWPRGSAEAADVNVALQTVLRLPELPPGYVTFDDSCERADESSELEHVSPVALGFLAQNRLEGCIFRYQRTFRTGHGPAPKEIQSASVVAADPAVAAGAATLIPELIAAMAGESGYTEVPSPEKIGDETLLFHVANPAGPENVQPPASVLFWRSGRVLAGILIPRDDQEVIRLAHLQQAHVEAPSPYTLAERDSSLVELDDPRLLAPVYWLGERFSPGHGFPPARTERAYGLPFYGKGGNRLAFAIDYTRGLVLIGWNPPAWKHFSSGEAGRRDWTWHCTRSRRVQLRQGHAVVYAAYKKDYARCPNRPPRHYFAHVFLPGTVVGINQEACTASSCSPFYSPAFNSFRGMATVARHLHPRAPRTR